MRALVIALVLTILGPGRADAERILLVPADGDLPKPLANLPAVVTSAIAKALKARGKDVQIAKASRVDILTLADCPDGSAGCLNKVTKLLELDVAILVTTAPSDTGAFVDVALIHRDGRAPVQDSWAIDGKTSQVIADDVVRRLPALFGDKVEPTEPAAPAEPAGPPAVTAPPEDEPPPGIGSQPGGPQDDRPSALGRVKITSWILAGAGLGLVGAGTVFLLDAGDKQSEIDAFDPRTSDDFVALEQLEDDASSTALLGNILVGAGVVATGVAATLIVIQIRSEPEQGGVAISPMAVDRGVGLTFTVRGDL